MTCAPSILRLATLTTLLGLIVLPNGWAGPVIEPTMEPVIRSLAVVPRGAPTGTRPGGAALSQDHVEITFVLPSDERAIFRLVHPSVAPPGSTEHGPFALVSDVTADHPLRRAFVSAIDRESGRFRWALAGTREAEGSDPLGDARSSLRMVAHEAVERSVDQAVSLAGDDVPTLREASALLKAAGFAARSAELVAQARRRLDSQREQLSVRLGGERASLHALAGEPYESEAKRVLGSGARGACALTALTDTLALLGEHEAAAKWLDAILVAAPACRAAHHQRCELRSLAKDWEGLLTCARAGAKAVGGDVDFGVREATALRGLGRYEEAIPPLEAAVRARPHASGPMSSLANLYTMTRTDEAKWSELEGKCVANPDDIVTCFLAGVLAHYLAKHESCVARMTSLLDALPKQPRVPMYAAISSFYLGRVADADRLIDRAARISGAMDPDVYYCRSLIRRERDRQSAIEDLERFLQVATRGWHSEGKIERVTGELALLRKGIIPPPAEAHHRAEDAPVPEGARSGAGDLRPVASVPSSQEPTAQGAQGGPQEPPSGLGSSMIWWLLVLGLMAVIVGVGRR